MTTILASLHLLEQSNQELAYQLQDSAHAESFAPLLSRIHSVWVRWAKDITGRYLSASNPNTIKLIPYAVRSPDASTAILDEVNNEVGSITVLLDHQKVDATPAFNAALADVYKAFDVFAKYKSDPAPYIEVLCGMASDAEVYLSDLQQRI